MRPTKEDRRTRSSVSASELAQMGVCEKRMRFEATLGKRRTSTQDQDSERGITRHGRFHQDAVRRGPGVQTSEPQPSRCFVATVVFGESPETRTLREFRDTVLQRHWMGRAVIAVYYAVGPTIAAFLAAGRRRQGIVRILLRPLVRKVEKDLAARMNRADSE